MDLNPKELRQLIQAYLDERLSDSEFETLHEFLDRNPDARAQYVELAQLDAGLRDSGAALETNPISFPGRERSNFRWLAVAALLAALALPLWMVLQSNRTESPPLAATKGIAVITAEAGAVWGKDGNPLVQGKALEPGRLILKKGLAQIDFYGGASISLSGPAVLELVNGDAAILHSGTLKADVPPAARGFEVRTGQVLLEDLGTSFGLSVEENEEADLVVFDGEVRATGADGNPILLLEGDSARLSQGKATRQNANLAGDFPDITDVIAGSGDRKDIRYAAWKESSLDRRRDPRLIAYYDFEDLTAATRRLRNQALHTTGSELDGGIVGAKVTKGRWGRKTALDFRSEGDRVRFQIPGSFDAISIYAWVRIDALDRGLNSLFLTDYYDENEFHWQISREGALHFASSPEGVVDLPKNNRRFYSTSFWDPGMSGQWFLLATTAQSGESSEVIHYINGRAVGFSGGTNREKPLSKMRIGKADLGNWSEPIWDHSIRTLNGRIDEFAIYSAVLSAEEIAKIFEEGKP